jgi:hypothetical protein
MQGTLLLVPSKLEFRETCESVKQHSANHFYPGNTEYLFTAWLKCDNARCNQEVVSCGTGGLESAVAYGEDGSQQNDFVEYFVPRFCFPMPDMFRIPDCTPAEVQAHIRAGFALYFTDHNAAANRIRVALESLLDSQRIPRRRRIARGQSSLLNLHTRIEAFSRRNREIGNELMALKWLGNTASHDTEVSKGDLLDGLEVLEHILEETYEARSRRIARIAKTLTRKHS